MVEEKYSFQVFVVENGKSIKGTLTLLRDCYNFNGLKQSINWENASCEKGKTKIKKFIFSSEKPYVIICAGEVHSPAFVLEPEHESELIRTVAQLGEMERKRRITEEAERKAKEEAERKAKEEAERKAKEEAERKAKEEAERKAKEEAERKAKEEAERKAKEEAERKAKEEAERKAKEEAERKAKEEAERKAKEEAERKAKEEAERKAKEEAERKAKEEAERKAKEEAERKAKEEAERKAKEEAERKAKEEAERKAKEEAERKAKEEAERKAKEEAERKAKEEAERKAKEEAERKAKEEAERKAKEEAERKAKEEAERKAKEEAERKAKEEAERKAKEEAEHKAKEEAERKAKEEAERKAKEDAKHKATGEIPPGVLYQPGQEPAKIRAKIERLFEKLNQEYPDRVVASLYKNHKKWGETVTELYRQLGYPDGNSFLKAYGYIPEAGASGRPSSVDPEAIIATLKARYPEGTTMSMGELALSNADIPMRSLGNRAPQLYGMSLSAYLAKEGILLSGRSSSGIRDKEQLDELINTLKQRYEGKQKPAELQTLIAENPDLPIANLRSVINRLVNTTPAAYLVSEGILQGHRELSDEEKLAEIEEALVKKYKGMSPLPKNVAQIKQENPELKLHAIDALVTKVKGKSAKDYFTSLGLLEAEPDPRDELDRIISALKDRYIGTNKKAYYISDLKRQNPDLAISSLQKLVKMVFGKTQSEYLSELGILSVYDWKVAAELEARQIAERKALQLKNFRTELPLENLCQYYMNRYIDETTGNPYYKAIRDLKERDIVLPTIRDKGTVGEKDQNNCFVHDGVLLSCSGGGSITIADGIEIIGQRGFAKPDSYGFNEDILEIQLPDSVRTILFDSYGYKPSVDMNIPKGYLLATTKLPEKSTEALLKSIWKYDASILDWVSIFFTQDRERYGEMCTEAFGIYPNATVAAFIAFLNVHCDVEAVNEVIKWVFDNRGSIAQQILDDFFTFGKKIGNKRIMAAFGPISSVVSSGYSDDNDKLAIAGYVETYDSPEYQKMKKVVGSDLHYKGASTSEIHWVTVIVSLYIEEWNRCSTMISGSMSTVNVLQKGTKLKPVKICDELIPKIDKDNFISFIKSKVDGRDYRNFIVPFAYYGSEKDINWFISAIKTASKGKAQDRYRAESSEQALYLSDTRAAIIYFDKAGQLHEYAAMRGLDADELRINFLYNFDFDSSGKKVYDLGGKHIVLSLQDDLTVVLYDLASGKIVKSIPKKDSDPVKYEEAKADFDDKKASIKKVAKSVCDGLFHNFLSGKSYAAADWKRQFFSNPVLKIVAKLVVWVQGSETFTVTDGGLVTVDNLPYVLSEDAIMLAHPMELDGETITNWQKYFISHGIKQPFDQIWEPVINFERVNPDRYTGCEIPLFRFNAQEKHGISLNKESEYNYMSGKYEYSSLKIGLQGCTLDWKITTGDIRNATMQSMITVNGFSFRSANRQTNHIIAYLDKCTVFGRIANDDDSVLEQLEGYTVSQIDAFLKFAIEKSSTKCTAAFLNYKNEHFADFATVDEFTLDF